MLVDGGFEDPYLYFEEPTPDSVELLGGNSNGQCTVAGMSWDCMSANRLRELGAAEEMVSATVFAIYNNGKTRAIWSGLVATTELLGSESSFPVDPVRSTAHVRGTAGGGGTAVVGGAAGVVGTGSNGHAPDSGFAVLAGTSDSSVTVIAGAAYVYAGPQNPPYDPRVDFRDYAVSLAGNNSITDCNKLALLIYKAGQVFGGQNPFYFENRDRIVHGLMAGLTEFTRVTLGGREGPSNPNYRVGVFQRDRYFAGGFHDSGFDARFQDGGNQVRHFIFYFGAGYGIGETTANAGLYDAEGTRSGRNADVALGWEGTKRGARFQGDYKQLAQDVWRHVCGQSSPLNLP